MTSLIAILSVTLKLVSPGIPDQSLFTFLDFPKTPCSTFFTSSILILFKSNSCPFTRRAKKSVIIKKFFFESLKTCYCQKVIERKILYAR